MRPARGNNYQLDIKKTIKERQKFFIMATRQFCNWTFYSAMLNI